MDDLWTIADSIADALDLAEREVSDLLNEAPFVAMLPAEESSNGTQHSYTKRTGAPNVGFRAVNAGRALSKSGDTRVNVDLKVLDWSFGADKAAADIWRKGKEHFIAKEGLAHVGAALFVYEQQVFYGQAAGAPDGFAGLVDSPTTLTKALEMVVDATGTTVNGATSVWGIRLGSNDVLGIYNGDGEISMGETIVQDMLDSEGRHFPAYYTPACTWLALQVGGAHSFGRIVNLTAEVGKTLTDDHLSMLLSKAPAGKPFTHFLMNRRSRQQLQDSRTATTTTGAPAPFPTEAFGIPIVTTDAIVNTEPIVA